LLPLSSPFSKLSTHQPVELSRICPVVLPDGVSVSVVSGVPQPVGGSQPVVAVHCWFPDWQPVVEPDVMSLRSKADFAAFA
jgi:hypothetical protein